MARAVTPGAVLFSDVGRKAAGHMGHLIVSIIIYSLDATRCVILHLAAAQVLHPVISKNNHRLGSTVKQHVTCQAAGKVLGQALWLDTLQTWNELRARGCVAHVCKSAAM